MEIKITSCKGEGQGSCTRCDQRGKWNRYWMCFLNEIEGVPGTFCSKCTQEIKEELQNGKQ